MLLSKSLRTAEPTAGSGVDAKHLVRPLRPLTGKPRSTAWERSGAGHFSSTRGGEKKKKCSVSGWKGLATAQQSRHRFAVLVWSFTTSLSLLPPQCSRAGGHLELVSLKASRCTVLSARVKKTRGKSEFLEFCVLYYYSFFFFFVLPNVLLQEVRLTVNEAIGQWGRSCF